MDNMPDQAATEGRSVKRRRVALACDACRTRKSRCDGRRPQCGMCKDLDFDCVYTAPVTATNVIVQKDYLSDLEHRVKTLEDSLGTVKTELSAVASKVNGECRSDRPVSETTPSRQKEQSADLMGTEDTVDGMGAVAFADEEDCGFFGASSNIAFLRNLSRAVVRVERTQEQITSPPVNQGSFDGGFVNERRPCSLVPPVQAHEGSRERQSSMFSLPSDDEMLPLIHRFFGDTGLLFPYIHPHAFFETYSELKGSKKVRRTWLGLLNMVLAMAKLTAVSERTPAEVCLKESAVYYTRAFDLCRGEILRGTTLEVVQCLLLMGQYLQGTHKSVQAWMIHGLTVKAAMQLGLQSKDASQSFPPLEQEIRKRTWFGCVVLDRLLSMTFGRPAAIPDCYVQLDLPTFLGSAEGFPTADLGQARDSILFFNGTITLYKQMAFIIDQLYGQNLGCGSPLPVREIVSRVLGIESQLFSWEIALPESMRRVTIQTMRDEIEIADSGQSRNNHEPFPPSLFPLKFRVILTLRYLHVQILLYRPVLAKFLDITGVSGDRVVEPAEDRLLNDIGYSSVKKCVEAAMGIIDIIHELISSLQWSRNLLGAWWYSLYYTFNAALVIIGATWVHRTSKPAAHAIANIEIYPGRAVDTLSKLDRGNRMVDRCRYYLEQLISALRLNPQQEETPSASVPNMGFPPSDLGFPSLGIEGGEFMVDDLFSSLARGADFERW
ncbi:fungal-specific transcription factor domain-containing protein [Aspergillus unguis]